MEKTFHYDNWAYKIDAANGDVVIFRYFGNDTDVIIPVRINGMKVCRLDSFIFSESPANVNVKRVVLSEGIRKIGLLTFLNSNIQEVVLPSTIQDVDGTGFGETIKQVTVDLNNPLYFDIDGVLFSRKGKEMHLVYFPAGRTGSTYKVPDGTTHVDGFAFNASKNLERIIVPNSVIDLNNLAFMNCPKLVSVRLSPNIEKLKEDIFCFCSVLSDVRVSRKINVISPNAFGECPQFKGINIQTRMSERER
jgi:hypothetical protein